MNLLKLSPQIKFLQRMNLLRKTLQLCLLIVLLPMNSGIARAEFSKESRPSHMLNSQTVESGMEISYLGNMVFALDRNTNLGTQGLFFLGGLPNLTLKHRMFDFENGSTTFNVFFMLSHTDRVFLPCGDVLSTQTT